MMWAPAFSAVFRRASAFKRRLLGLLARIIGASGPAQPTFKTQRPGSWWRFTINSELAARAALLEQQEAQHMFNEQMNHRDCLARQIRKARKQHRQSSRLCFEARKITHGILSRGAH